MKRLLLAGAILTAVTQPALTQTAGPPAPLLSQLTVTGRVIAEETGGPVPNARITIAGQAIGAPVVLTNPDGRFSLTAPPGRHNIAASKSGYAPSESNASTAGTPVEIRLHRAAVLSGRVMDDLGEPIPGARVTAEIRSATQNKANIAAVRETDDRGEFRLGGLKAGRYVVAVTTIGVPAATQPSGDQRAAMSSVFQTTFYPGVPTFAEAEDVTIEYGEHRADVDFVVASSRSSAHPFSVVRAIPIVVPLPKPRPQPTSPPTAVIRGRVLSADGSALSGAQVLLAPESSLADWRLARADSGGRFEFRDLRADTFRLAASKLGYFPLGSGEANLATLRSLGTRISLKAGETREAVDIRLTRWGTLSGHVLDEYGDPLHGATVQLLQIRYERGRRRLVPSSFAARPTDDVGAYRLYGLAPGQYVVSAAVGDVSSADLPGYTRSYYPSTPIPSQAQFIAIASGQDVAGIDVALSRLPTARVSGRMITAAGGSTMGGRVSLIPSQRSASVTNVPVGARILPDGRFEFANVPPGQYVVQAYRGRLNSWTEGEFGALPVSVGDDDVTGLVVRMSAGSSVAGRISFDAPNRSTQPARSSIEISPIPTDFDQSPPDPFAVAEIRPDWSFDIFGLNGPRRLQVVRAPPGWTLKEIRVNGLDVTDRPLPFGRSEQSLAGIEVVFTDRLSVLSGTVRDDDARPAPNAQIVVFSTDRTRWYSTSRFLRAFSAGNDGRFSVEGLPFGTYYTTALGRLPADGEDAWQDPAFLSSLIGRASTVTVRDGETQTIALRISLP
jgi:protocatechuate 3,4-dioxygenase beta subunit